MTLKDYTNFVNRMMAPIAHSERLTAGAMGLAGEAGEVIDLLKKVKFHGHELDHTKFLLELGDALFYLVYTADHLGYNLDDVIEANVQKLEARYASGKFTREESVNRVE